ncbi:hypothetical protein [Thermomonospora umbrina]|uniref:Uncharacterized protein n=1 Tax=Thermomonospora umbrina TaxID=111806 RepID=A0A3D9SQ33_9ACTN|nr:hypothetical protein [Thermomonospora umbrina]REE98062.1 hypothetical protein DFJ69_3542 [Thermomonospora umbrina]
MSFPQPWSPGQPEPEPPAPSPSEDGARLRGPRVPKPAKAGIAVVTLVAAIITLGAFWGNGWDDGRPAASDTGSRPAVPLWTAKAAERLGGLSALRYTGTFTSSGQNVQVALSVTRAGSAVGTLTKGGVRAELVSVGGATYVKGGPTFWASASGPTARPEDFAWRWSKAPVTVLGFDVHAFLSPASIASLVKQAPSGETAGTLRGRPAHRVETSLGVYWLSTTAPYELLRVEGVSDTRFDVTAVPNAAPVLSELRRRAAALGGARDPGIRFEHGELQFVNCNENIRGCTVRLPVSTQTPMIAESGGTARARTAPLRARLTATITADGRALGTCTVTRSLGVARSGTLSCTVTSDGWRTWMRRARDVPGRHEYAAQARVVAEAVHPDQVAGLLAAVDRERLGR